MKIVKGMSGLGVGLAALASAVATSAEDSRKWYAIAYPHKFVHEADEWRFDYSSYGIAWNYPTEAAAITAAVAECEKRSGSKCKEYPPNVDHDHCFAITRSIVLNAPGSALFGLQKWNWITRDLYQTEEEARRVETEKATDTNRRMREGGYGPRANVEMAACSGDPRNRGANQ